MKEILKILVDTACEDCWWRRHRRGYKSSYKTNLIYRTPFDVLIKTLKNAFKALEKVKRMQLQPNETYTTQYSVKALELPGRYAQFIIITDNNALPKLGVCGMDIHRGGGVSLSKQTYFIDKNDLNNEFYEYVEQKRNENSKNNKENLLRKKIFKL